MAEGVTVDGDLHVMGRITAGTMTIPVDSVTDASVSTSSPISATKTQRRDRADYAQESATTAADEARTIHVANAAGTVKKVKVGSVVANIGDSTVTVTVKKNNVSILTGVVTLTSSHTARQVVEGTLDGALDDYAANDVFEVVIDATVGTGTLAKGVFVSMVFDENPS